MWAPPPNEMMVNLHKCDRPHGLANLPQRSFALWLSLGVFMASATPASAHAQQVQDQTQKENATKPQVSQQKITFDARDWPISYEVLLDENGKPLMIKNKKNQDVGISIHWNWWTASNGEKVAGRYSNLVSPTFAYDFLKSTLKGAKILERKPKTNEKGKTVGERIVALLYVPIEPHKRGPNDPHKTVTAVIRTEGTKYWEVCANTVDVALALEKYLDDLSDTRKKP
jgi:hypothetical protein